MDTAVTMEFLSLILVRLTGGLVSIRFILFAMVGLSGVAVQLLAVRFMLMFTEVFWIAQVFGVFVAMNSNFFLNNVLTYRDLTIQGLGFIRGLLSFYAVCAIGAMVNVGIAELLNSATNQWLIASATGAFAGALWNFTASSLFTWRTR